MSKLRNLVLGNKTTVLSVLGVFVLAGFGVFMYAPDALAQSAIGQLGTSISNMIMLVIAYAAFFIASFVGEVLLSLVEILIWVAGYNDFIGSQTVKFGWVIVRDVVNMFFILGLLIIAFATILGIESYSYGKNLAKFLIMAIAVNFSQTVMGLLIDFSQILMLTFVGGFASAAGGNFISAFQLDKLYQASPNAFDAGSVAPNVAIETMASMILALLMVTAATAVILFFTLLLVQRIVMLWILVILSPLAFFLSALPGDIGKGQYGEWKSLLVKQLIAGPLLAFFLWLSLVSVAVSGQNSGSGLLGSQPAELNETKGGGWSQAFEKGNISNFIVAIALMLGGADMALKMAGGVAAGKWASGKSAAKGALAAGQNMALAPVRGARDLAAKGLRRAALGRKVTDERTGKERYEGGLVSLPGVLAGGALKVASRELGTTAVNTKQGRSQLYKDASAADVRGDSATAAKLRARADKLSEQAQKQSWIGRTARNAVGAVAGVGMSAGASGERLADAGVREDYKKAREKVKKLNPQEIEDIALGKVDATKQDRAAAIMEGSKQGLAGLRGKQGELGDFLKKGGFTRAGADDSTMGEYTQAVRDKYWIESDMGVTGKNVADSKERVTNERAEQLRKKDPSLSADAALAQAQAQMTDDAVGSALIDERRQAAADNGRLPINEKTTPVEMEEMSKFIAGAPPAQQARTIEKLTQDQVGGLIKGLETAIKGMDPKDAYTQKLDSNGVPAVDASGAPIMEESAGLKNMRTAMANAGKGKDYKKAFSIGANGSFGAMTNDKDGTQATLVDAAGQKEAFKKSLLDKGAHKNLLKLNAGDLSDASGNNTEVMDAVLEALTKNPDLMGKMVQDVQKEPSGPAADMVEKFLAGVASKGGAESYIKANKGVSRFMQERNINPDTKATRMANAQEQLTRNREEAAKRQEEANKRDAEQRTRDENERKRRERRQNRGNDTP